MIFNLFAFVVAFIFVLLYYVEGLSTQISPYAWTAVTLFILLLVAYFVALRVRNKQVATYWFNPSYIVLFGLIVVNLQTIINVLLGYAPISSYLHTTSYDAYINEALFAGLFVITGFIIGCYNATPKSNMFSIVNIEKVAKPIPSMSVFVVLYVASFLMFIMNIDIASFVTGLHYEGSGSYDRVSGLSYMFYEQLFGCFLVIIFSIIAYEGQQQNEQVTIREFLKKVPIIVWLVLSIYLILRLLSGDRGAALFSLGVVGYSYLMLSRRRFSLITLLSVLIVGAFAVTILGVARGFSKSDSFVDRIEMAVDTNIEDAPTICSPTQELANSVNCNFIAIADMDAGKIEVQNGKYSFYNLVTCFPGSLKLLNIMFGLTQKDINSAEYITISFFGDYYPYGLGTTTTAEGLLDFGLIGCFILNLIFGLMMRRIDSYFIYNQRISMTMTIIAIKFASEAIYVSRASYTGMLSKAIYIVILFVIVDSVVKMLKKS